MVMILPSLHREYNTVFAVGLYAVFTLHDTLDTFEKNATMNAPTGFGVRFFCDDFSYKLLSIYG